jgi:hypothetical protein
VDGAGASRIVYLADFSMAILAASETLFSSPALPLASTILNRILTAISIVCTACPFVSAVFGHTDINPWVALRFLL